MSTHNIRFYGEITKIIPKLSSNSLLICSTVQLSNTGITKMVNVCSVQIENYITDSCLYAQLLNLNL